MPKITIDLKDETDGSPYILRLERDAIVPELTCVTLIYKANDLSENEAVVRVNAKDLSIAAQLVS